ncbi:MAG: dynamin family protein [Verrucomicrobiota bacterium]
MNTPAPVTSIKTDIFEFCQAYAGIIKPFAAALQGARATCQGKGDADVLQRPIAGFSDVHHRLESLLNKVEEQQAYLIIFGPLKSGKSTLMNAISAAYVSEVTSLPAYPCLVHVKHGDECSYVASRYDGEKLHLADNAALQALIQQSHQTLAGRLREVEDKGDTFDPGVHYPEAIRRVDVAMPARNLKDSLTVLVDTPGLYTRMKFGYDLMTREFRNSAACAVFVVKTDNLFLEQVFEEFNDLLDLFSRIFIVVNIDSNKRDLDPDGSLRPSLESESPGEVIRAFESLVMSAPLRRAQEAGRLKIYPIDLLNSASAAMRRATEPESGTDPLEAGQVTEAVATEANETAARGGGLDGKTSVMPMGWAEHPEASFSLFLKDLTNYLNSSDYLQEFMGDALLMGTNLGTEIREYCSPESTAALEIRQQKLATEFSDTQARLAAMEKLAAVDVKAAFGHIRGELQKHVAEVAAAAAAEAKQRALRRLGNWFECDQSVAELQRDWADLLDSCSKRVTSESHLKECALVANPLGGIRIDDPLRSPVLGLIELLEPVVASARATLGDAAPTQPSGLFQIEPEQLKVRKSVWDWLAIRSLAAVRRKLFGAPDALDREVPVLTKEKRLGEEGRQALEERILSELARRFPSEALRVSESRMTRYIEMYGKQLQATLQAAKDKDAAHLKALQQRLEDNVTILQTLGGMTRQTADVLAQIIALGRKYRSYSRVTSAAAQLAAAAADVTRL